jgi:hypothetical protein
MSDKGYVYFVETDSPPNTYIKIGFSRNPRSRLKDLQTCSPFPLKILKIIEGTQDDETIFHKKFKQINTHGEWFKKTPELLEEIGFLRAAKKLIPKKNSRMAWIPKLPKPPRILSFDEIRSFEKKIVDKLAKNCSFFNKLESLARIIEYPSDEYRLTTIWHLQKEYSSGKFRISYCSYNNVVNDTARAISHCVLTRQPCGNLFLAATARYFKDVWPFRACGGFVSSADENPWHANARCVLPSFSFNPDGDYFAYGDTKDTTSLDSLPSFEKVVEGVEKLWTSIFEKNLIIIGSDTVRSLARYEKIDRSILEKHVEP